MSAAYLSILLVSMAGIAIIDARGRLFLWRAPLRAGLVLIVGLVFFLMWDVAGIALGLFLHRDSPFMIGILVAPHLPVEEVLFLLFLCHLTMVVLLAAPRVMSHLTGRTATRTTLSRRGRR